MEKRMPWYVPDKWCGNLHNWSKEIREQMPNLPKRVFLRDCMLREGAETAGVSISVDDAVEIAKRLEEIGVAELELPAATASKGFYEIVKAVHDAGIKIPKSVLTRVRVKNVEEEVDAVAKAGGNVFRISGMFVSDWHLNLYKQISLEELISRALRMIRYAKREYPDFKFEFGQVDATRTPIERLKKIWKQAASEGADACVLFDTLGVGTAATEKYMFSEVKKVVKDKPLFVHCHNDFGTATANTLGAVEGGAEWCDVVINGLGDRGGNASLEEVACSLEMNYGVDTGIKLEKLYELSQFIEEKTVKLQYHKAIVGRNAFLEQAEYHVVGVLTGKVSGLWQAWEPYKPHVVGRKHILVWGPATLWGESIKIKLDQMGLKYSDDDLKKIRDDLTAELRTKTWITEEELEKKAKEIVTKKK